MELKLENDLPGINFKTGKFQKGRCPFNKGKKWSEYMSEEGVERAKKGWQNLVIHRPKKRPDNAGRCSKPVIAVNDEGRWRPFASIAEAAKYTNALRENIRRCCMINAGHIANKRTGKVNTDHKYVGLRWYYENDNQWMEKINNY